MKIFILLTILTLITACSSTEPVNFENHIQNPHPVDRSK